MTPSAVSTSYAFRPGARCLLGGGDVAVLLPAKERLAGLTRAQLALLRALNTGPVTVPAVTDSAVTDSALPDQETSALVDRLIEAGVVAVTVSAGDRRLYSLRPFRRPPGPRPTADRAIDDRAIDDAVGSRFTVIRGVEGQVVAENPRSFSDVVIHDDTILAVLTGLRTISDAGLGSDVTARVAADLRWTGLMVDPGAESNEFSTRSWSPHELWFHRRSTVGNRAAAFAEFGPTRWADGHFEPVPARREAFPGQPVALPVPDLDEVRAHDQTLISAVESRKSFRDFDDDHPITLAQLGELLYRCARTRDVRVIDADRDVPEELPSRPYPSGGSLYELEIYPVIRAVDGVAPGMYHYDSYDHVLRPVAPFDSPAVRRLLTPAALTLANGQLPQVLLTLAARTGRIMWTYEQMPYAVILKHVGVLTQTLYLTATAMGLGGVAQGYGDTEAFAEATGVDELTEANVGTFVVGAPRR